MSLVFSSLLQVSQSFPRFLYRFPVSPSFQGFHNHFPSITSYFHSLPMIYISFPPSFPWFSPYFIGFPHHFHGFPNQFPTWLFFDSAYCPCGSLVQLSASLVEDISSLCADLLSAVFVPFLLYVRAPNPSTHSLT